jgi:DNA-binding NtrC family response regulator
MNEQVSALVVNEDASVLLELRAILEDQAVTTRCARTCEEAQAALLLGEGPDIIFAGTSFPDGTWRDVVSMARRTCPRATVIVTTSLADIQLCLDTMEEGAADYIVPPFAACDVAHVIRSAIQDVARERFQVGAAGASLGQARVS